MRPLTLFLTWMAVAAAGCSTTGNEIPHGTVTGEASYLERMAVPPGTQLEVVLEDVSRADVAARTIGRQLIADAGQPPYRFEIRYPTERIVASHRYAVRARLTSQGQLLFTTDHSYPVITGGAPTKVELLLRRVSASQAETKGGDSPLGALPATFTGDLPCADCEAIEYHLDLLADRSFFMRMVYRGKPGGPYDDIGSWAIQPDADVLVLHGGGDSPTRFSIERPAALTMLSRDGKRIVSKLNYTLTRSTQFSPIEPRLGMRGMYRYFADSGTFSECLTGRKMPVAMEADNRALERAYTKVPRNDGEELLVSIEGRIAQRMPMEGPGPVLTLIPEKFVGIWPGETCGQRFASADLANTYWKLTRLRTDQVLRAEKQREPHIVLRGDQRVAGSDGCNRMTGTYRLKAEDIAFSRLASTMMACPQGMEQAQRFRNALGSVTRYRIVGQHLEFLDAVGSTLLRFEAVALR